MKKLYIILLILLLTNCATPYQKESKWWQLPPGGYSEAKRGENIFFVVFNANGITPLVNVKDYALLRSAEVTVENNFSYFRIDSGEAKYVQHYSSSCYNGICTPIVVNLPTAFNVISCFKQKVKSKNADIIYNAKTVIDEIKLKYKM